MTEMAFVAETTFALLEHVSTCQFSAFCQNFWRDWRRRIRDLLLDLAGGIAFGVIVLTLAFLALAFGFATLLAFADCI